MPRRPAVDALRDPWVVLWLPVAGVALGQRFLVPGISAADVALALFLPPAAILLLQRAPGAPWPPWARWLLAFCAWALAGGLWLAVRGEAGFSVVEFAKSASKLVFYSAAAVLLAKAARLQPADRMRRIVLWSFAAAAAVAVGLYAAMVAGVPLARDLVCGEAWGPCNAAYYYERRWLGDSSPRGIYEGAFVRAVGLSTEPARLGLSMSLALGYLLLGSRAPWRRPWMLALITAAAVLSFSLSGYAVLVPVLGLAAVRLLRQEPRARRAAALAALAVAVVTAAVPPVRATLQGPIGRRAHRLFSGEGVDESARLRLLGSWDMALMLVERRPVAGVGLGHFDRHVPEIRDRLPGGQALDDTVQGWNVLAYVLATTGGVGVLLFALACYRALRPRPELLALSLLAMFADGTVLGPGFWVFLALYADAAGRSEAEASVTAPAG